jgi:hypothetical protein
MDDISIREISQTVIKRHFREYMESIPRNASNRCNKKSR